MDSSGSNKPLNLWLVGGSKKDAAAIKRTLRQERLLKRFAHHSSFEVALNAQKAAMPDVDIILCEQNLGELGYRDFCQAVKLSHNSIPIIVLVEVGREAEALDFLNAGMDDFIMKDDAGNYLQILPHRLLSCLMNFQARKNCLEYKSELEKLKAKQQQLRFDLEYEEKKCRSLFESANDAIFLLDQDIFVDCNPRGEEFFRCSRERIIGSTPYDFSPPLQPDGRDSREKALEMISAVIEGAQPVFPWQHRGGDGSLIDAEISLNPVVINGKSFIQAMARDVTTKKRLIAELERSKRDLFIKNQISQIFLTSSDQEAYERVLNIVLESIDSELGILGFLNEAGDLVISAMVGKNKARHLQAARDRVFQHAAWMEFWRIPLEEKRTFHSNEPLDVPEGHFPIQRAISVPIVYQGEIIGVITVANKASSYTEQETATLESIVAKMAPVLQVRLQQDLQEEKRTETEKALQESEERFRTLVENQGEGVGIVGLDETFIFANPAADHLFGLPPGWLTGRNLTEFLEADQLAIVQRHTQTRYHGVRSHYELRIKSADGAAKDIIVTATPLFDQEGNLKQVLGVFRDITGLKKAEKALTENQELLNATLESTADGILVIDKNGKVMHSNSRFAQMWRIPEDMMVSQDDNQLLRCVLEQLTDPEEFLQHVRELYQTELEELNTLNFKDGRIFERYTCPLMQNGEITGRVWSFRDVTEPRSTQQGLLESEEKFRTIASSALDAIVMMDNDGKTIFWNKAAEQIFGYSEAEVLGKNLHQLVAPEDLLAVHLKAFADFQKSGRGAAIGKLIELSALRKDGTTFPVEITVSAVKIRNQWNAIAIVRDITARKLAEDSLRKSNEFQRLLLKTAATAIFTTDAQDCIISVNEAFQTITGYTKEDVIGKHCYAFLRSPTPDKECDFLTQSQEEQVLRKECIIKAKNGKSLTTLKNAILLWGENGQFSGAIESFVDVTELIEARKRAEEINQELWEANQELERAIQYAREMANQAEMSSVAKSVFLANMSHEIRTPLNGILGFAQLLMEEENLNVEQRDFVNTIYSSGTALLGLINDILDFSKIEAGKLDLETIPFDFLTTVEGVCEILSRKVSEKELELNCFVSPEIPSNLIGDPSRLRQVLMNLLGNAVKFTKHGEITVTVEPEERHQKEIVLRFIIRDTGIGIPADRLDVIFNSFTQADGSTTRKYGGTGLGLAISKRLVELLGGRIWVISESSKGSTFYFTAHFSVAEVQTPKQRPVEEMDLQGLPVLIVDDNATNRRFLKELLQIWKLNPTAVEGARKALTTLRTAAARQEPFSLVLLDAQMPEVDGFELAETIKEDPVLKDTTLILLTSAGRRGDSARCKAAGISAYLNKPIKQSDLWDAMLTTISESLSPRPTSDLVTIHTLRESKAHYRILLAEDNVVNQRLVVNLLSKRGHSVQVAGTGKEVIAALERSSQGFDAVLMDVQMPEMDGLEATKQIREQEKSTGAHIPIIAMTAHAMKGDRETCLHAGMDTYISKPIKTDELLETLERLLHDSKRRVNPVKTQTNPSGDNENDLDLNALLERVDGDKELLQEIAALFLEDQQRMLSDIQQALESKDPQSLEQAAHTLKGSVSNFGADSAVNLALKLEMKGRNRTLEQTEELLSALKNEIGNLNQQLAALVEAEDVQ
ncbi:MAG: PAS domain S-box protein [bacterium]